MTLFMFKDIQEIGGFKRAYIPKDAGPCDIDTRYTPVIVSDKTSAITFYIQNGPIKEVGVNGCQVDTLIHAAKIIIEEFNKKIPCAENDTVIADLTHAIEVLEKRRKDRENRGVEGTSKE